MFKKLTKPLFKIEIYRLLFILFLTILNLKHMHKYVLSLGERGWGLGYPAKIRGIVMVRTMVHNFCCMFIMVGFLGGLDY